MKTPLPRFVRFLRRTAVFLPVVGVALAAPTAETMADTATNTPEFLDFAGLDRPASPNHWLVAPPGNARGLQPDSPAADLDVAPARLAAAWLEVVSGAPRTNIVAVSEDGLRVEAEQRSALFGFVDKISFEAVPRGDGGSSYFAYSRSQLGFWDIGVNKSRLTEWDTALQQAVGGETPR